MFTRGVTKVRVSDADRNFQLRDWQLPTLCVCVCVCESLLCLADLFSGTCLLRTAATTQDTEAVEDVAEAVADREVEVVQEAMVVSLLPQNFQHQRQTAQIPIETPKIGTPHNSHLAVHTLVEVRGEDLALQEVVGVKDFKVMEVRDFKVTGIIGVKDFKVMEVKDFKMTEVMGIKGFKLTEEMAAKDFKVMGDVVAKSFKAAGRVLTMTAETIMRVPSRLYFPAKIVTAVRTEAIQRVIPVPVSLIHQPGTPTIKEKISATTWLRSFCRK